MIWPLPVLLALPTVLTAANILGQIYPRHSPLSPSHGLPDNFHLFLKAQPKASHLLQKAASHLLHPWKAKGLAPALPVPSAFFRHSPDHTMWKCLSSWEPVSFIIMLTAPGRGPGRVYHINQSLWSQGSFPQEAGSLPLPHLESQPLLFLLHRHGQSSLDSLEPRARLHHP